MRLKQNMKYTGLIQMVSFIINYDQFQTQFVNLKLYFFIVTEYLKGSNWRVHPDWVYCEYNNLHNHERERDSSGESYSREREENFETPEDQLLHFLARIGRPGWKWMSVSLI